VQGAIDEVPFLMPRDSFEQLVEARYLAISINVDREAHSLSGAHERPQSPTLACVDSTRGERRERAHCLLLCPHSLQL
jgi:hypothetical protein